MACEKNANVLIEKMGDLKLLSLIEHSELISLLVDIIKLSEIDYLKKFLDKCQVIKKIDPLIFSENYQTLLNCSLNETIEKENKVCCEALLDSELIDIHGFEAKGRGGYMWAASRGAKLAGLACLIEKGASFTHIDKKNGNVFHSLGETDYTIESKRSIKCLDYLMNHNEKVKQNLENTNYKMLYQTNDDGFGPLIMYLKSNKSELALFIIDHLSDFEVLAKIQQQIKAYFLDKNLDKRSLKVIEKLNEKMIKNEKDTLNAVISGNSLSKASHSHKI